MRKPSFTQLKNNYKTDSSDTHSCTMQFPNTCAIRMSEALVKTNTAFLNVFKGSGKNVCPHGYMRGAQDLASVLAKSNVLGARDLGWVSPGKPPSNVLGQTGIICYMNIPAFSGQGHIDLWNFTTYVGSEYWNAQTIWMWVMP